MKLPGEEETGGGVGPSLIYMVIGVSAFVLIVLFAVFQGNDNKRGGSEYLQEIQAQKEEEAKQEELAAVQSLMNQTFAGKTLDGMGEVDEELVAAMHDPLFQIVLEEVVACINESDDGRLRRMGMSSLLSMPEFRSSSSVLPLVKLLEDEEVLCSVFDEAAEGDQDCLVRIGAENPVPELSEVSVVAGRYGRGDSAGIVAVIGPTRMDYGAVIRAVHAAQQALREG